MYIERYYFNAPQLAQCEALECVYDIGLICC